MVPVIEEAPGLILNCGLTIKQHSNKKLLPMSPWNLINKLIHFKVPLKPKHFFSKRNFMVLLINTVRKVMSH